MLTERVEFSSESGVEWFSAIPADSAVFRLRGVDERAEPYVSKTADLRRRLQRLLGPADPSTRKLNLRERVRWIEYAPSGSDFESRFLLYKIHRETFPENYGNRLRLRFAPLIKLHLENEYPRASITTRLGRLNACAIYYGPFQSRTIAEKFLNDSLDFFKMRRCVDDLHPDPKFPGCIYSEMKMCLAPCFKGCTDAEYSGEVRRVQDYFDSAGESLSREFSGQRDAASANLAFEDAASIQARLEKLKPVVSQFPEIVGRIDRLSALIVQPSEIADTVKLFRVEGGTISGPIIFPIRAAEHAKSQSMKARIQIALDSFPVSKPASALEIMEHLALLKRWYYRGSRIGEIFLRDDKNILPMRRIVRGIGRVLKGEGPEDAARAQTEPAPSVQVIKMEEGRDGN